MANGKTVDQATYYNDPVTYTGDSGTSTNKWVIEDAYDLMKERSGSGTNSAYYTIVNDIDLNDHDVYKYGYTGILFENKYRYSYHIDGGNHKIRNLIIKNITSRFIGGAGYGTIKNVVFENLVLMNCNPTVATNCAFSFKSITNCHFGVYLFNSSFRYLVNGYNEDTPISNCSFNIHGVSADDALFNQGIYTRCHFNLDIQTPAVGIVGSGAENVIFDNSYITGKITCPTSITESCSVVRDITMRNGYIATNMIFPNRSDTVGVYASPVCESVSFIDMDLVEGYYESDTDNLYHLTTEQATDPDYLLSIGFPVVKAE